MSFVQTCVCIDWISCPHSDLYSSRIRRLHANSHSIKYRIDRIENNQCTFRYWDCFKYRWLVNYRQWWLVIERQKAFGNIIRSRSLQGEGEREMHTAKERSTWDHPTSSRYYELKVIHLFGSFENHWVIIIVSANRTDSAKQCFN